MIRLFRIAAVLAPAALCGATFSGCSGSSSRPLGGLGGGWTPGNGGTGGRSDAAAADAGGGDLGAGDGMGGVPPGSSAGGTGTGGTLGSAGGAGGGGIGPVSSGGTPGGAGGGPAAGTGGGLAGSGGRPAGTGGGPAATGGAPAGTGGGTPPPVDAGAPEVRDAGSNMMVPDAAAADGGTGGSGSPLTCAVDLADCNRDPRDGCEASLTSPTHCGRCDNPCAAANATAACVNRLCAPLTCTAGFADCNNNRVDGCETALNLDSSCGSCERRCVSPTPFCGLAGLVRTCVNPAQALNDQRVELACLVPMTSPAYCGSIAPAGTVCPVTGRVVRRTFTVGGRPGTIYNVTFRIRGVVEPKVYAGGRGPGEHFYVGGTPTATNYNTYELEVSSPAQTYFLNYDEARGESPYVFALDHTKVIPVAGGATVNLKISDPDCVLITNCQAAPPAACVPYVVPGIPPAPAGFNGQFVHIDVVAVAVGP